MSGTLIQEWQPASGRVNDFGRSKRAWQCQTGFMGFLWAPSEAAGIAAGQKPLHPELIPYVWHRPAKWRQSRPRSSTNSLRSATEPRVVPRPLGSVRNPDRQLRNRSDRSIQTAAEVPAPLSAHIGGGGPDPALPSHLPRDSDRIPSRGTPRTHRPHPRSRDRNP